MSITQQMGCCVLQTLPRQVGLGLVVRLRQRSPLTTLTSDSQRCVASVSFQPRQRPPACQRPPGAVFTLCPACALTHVGQLTPTSLSSLAKRHIELSVVVSQCQSRCYSDTRHRMRCTFHSAEYNFTPCSKNTPPRHFVV